jgi:hypothetical protein
VPHTNLQSTVAGIIAENIDRLITVDFHARGIVEPVYREARRKQGEPLAYLAARRLSEACGRKVPVPSEDPRDRPVVIVATGFMIRGAGMPETDGVTGAALLARGLFLAFGAVPVIVTEEAAMGVLGAACGAAGLKPVSGIGVACGLPGSVAVLPFPVDPASARHEAARIADEARPAAMISIERPGMNSAGVHHNSFGASVSDITARIDELFLEIAKRRILTVAIGDLGNELGMGEVAEVVEAVTPFGQTCHCPCGHGIACPIPADVTVVGAVSDDVAYGMLACLAHIQRVPTVLPEPEIARAVLAAAVDAGAVDGVTGKCVMSIDVLGIEVHMALLSLLRAVLAHGEAHDRMRPEFLSHLRRLASL